MKYIVLGVTGRGGMKLEVPFVFPDLLVHKMMAEVCTTICRKTWPLSQIIVISAGFLSSTAFVDECHGQSVSLGVKSRERWIAI